MSFKIVVDSCCDLSPQMKKEPCFVRVPMTIQVDGSVFVAVSYTHLPSPRDTR